jgi:hypothetical protein
MATRAMHRVLGVLLASLVASAAHAQSRPASITTLTLDVIGPRTTGAVRSALRAHGRDLDRCRGDADGLVRVAFSIAPDGSVLAPTRVEDPSLDEAATDCALEVVATLHFTGHATSVTSVAWSFRLAARAMRTCWCFDWIHGADHGLTCEPTHARCDSERRSFPRESTECRSIPQPSCEHEAVIDGQGMREAH